jgi:nucleotide-binding universal stress UspA family protein
MNRFFKFKDMKRILFPTDFSQHAEKAIAYGLGLLQNGRFKNDLECLLLHVQPSIAPVMSPLGGVGTLSPSILQDKEMKRKEKMMFAAQAKYMKEYPRMTFRKMIVSDDVAVMIRKVAMEEDIDLIVMGSRGMNALERSLMGSTSWDLAQQAPCSVLIVPEEASTYVPKKIVFATDFKNLADLNILQPLKSITSNFDADLKLLHIHKEEVGEPNGKADVEEISTYFGGEKFKYYFIADDSPIRGIEDFVSGFNADLLALVAQERGFFESLFHRSVTKSLLVHSQIPLLILHPVFWGVEKDDPITFRDKVKRQTEAWRTDIEQLRVQSYLGKIEASESLDQNRIKAQKAMQDVKHRLDSAGEVAQDKWQHFQKEMAAAISHVKKALMG